MSLTTNPLTMIEEDSEDEITFKNHLANIPQWGELLEEEVKMEESMLYFNEHNEGVELEDKNEMVRGLQLATLIKKKIENEGKLDPRKIVPEEVTMVDVPNLFESNKQDPGMIVREVISLDGSKWFECVKCLYKTENMNDMEKHFLVSHTTVTLSCKQCSFVTKSGSELKLHGNVIHQRRCVGVTGESCEHGKCYDKSDDLSKYILEKHFNGSFQCKKCPFQTVIKEVLEKHVLNKHNTVPLECDHCPYVTKSRMGLKMHMSRAHQSRLPGKVSNPQGGTDSSKLRECEICSFKTKLERNLERHVLSDHPDAVVKCNQCIFKTRSNKNLTKHVQERHSGAVLECEQCSFITRSHNGLKLHVARIHKRF